MTAWTQMVFITTSTMCVLTPVRNYLVQHRSVHRLVVFGNNIGDRAELLLLWEGHALPLCLHAAAAAGEMYASTSSPYY